MTATVIPLGLEPAEPSRDDWQPRLLRLLVSSQGITTGDLRGIAPAGKATRDYLRWLADQGLIKVDKRHCNTCKCNQGKITVTDRAGLRRVLRHSDPRYFSAVYRTGQIAHRPATSTSVVT